MILFEQFEKAFPTDEACKEYIVRKRWPDGVRCPRCGAKEKVYTLKARPFHWTCCNKNCYGKVGVIGAIERKGNVVARVIGGMDAPTLAGFARRVTKDGVSLVMTDENPAYTHAFGKGTKHQAVNHGRGEYVRGDVHTNNIENFWSLLKRGVIGTYYRVSKDYLPLYLNEFSFRHNNRKNPMPSS